MIKNLLFMLFLLMSVYGTAQNNAETDLDAIETEEQAESFLASKKEKKNKIIVFNEEKHKSILAKELFKLSKGGVKTNRNDYEKTHYKVIDKKETPYYRVSYIYLDGNKLNLQEINSLRKTIMMKYQDGAPFDFLAKQYAMDESGKKGGDSGWFKAGDHSFDFENDITNEAYNNEEIFSLDIPETNSYYVILNSYKPKNISEIKVLKIVETL